MSSVQIADNSDLVANEPVSTWKDWVGIVASIGCAIHCAAMPFVIAYLPALGLSFLADESFHQWMALACFLIAICAFVPGLRKHGNWVPMSVGAIGLGIITYGAFGMECDCCPTCADQDTAAVATDDCESCECESCQAAESTSTSESDASESLKVAAGSVEANQVSAGLGGSGESGSKLMKWLAPWVTPLGGLLLVIAHLMNRRSGHLCSCCGNDEPVNLEATP